MATAKQLREFRKKALKSPRIGKRGKSKKTIAIEEARKTFEKIQLEKWEKISKAQIKDAIKDRRAREFTINQVIGKPKEVKEITTPEGKPLQIQISVKESIKKIYGNGENK